MKKKLSPVGIIMDTLRLSLSQLAEHLDISKSTLSKWRTGTRPISGRARYEQLLINYFIEIDNKNSQQQLASFFKSVYPNADFTTTDFVKQSLVRYIRGADDSEQKGNTTYRGVSGRKEALERLIAAAENMSFPCAIKILQLNSIEWQTRDMAFITQFFHRLDKLTQRGFEVEISFYITSNSPEIPVFFAELEILMYNRRVTVNIICDKTLSATAPDIYSLGGKCTVIGINHYENSADMYTAIFFDSFSGTAYLQWYNKIVREYAQPALYNDRVKVIERMQKCEAQNGMMIFIGVCLSICTMSLELLSAILKQNNINENEAKKCFLLHNTVKAAMQNPQAQVYFLTNYDKLKFSLSYEILIQPELSAILNKQIKITATQHQEHIRQSLQWFANQPHVSLGLLSNYSHFTHTVCAYIMENGWCIVFNDEPAPSDVPLLLYDDPVILDIIVSMSRYRTIRPENKANPEATFNALLANLPAESKKSHWT